ncbi:type II toxin-antitoxin system HicB family antitoxin [Skermanella rosea]|uniref:type II toxin-antitoxin system HicB family antitoxin n=1 Tax=Skermanella rosea TaxID=1817965 RepID=UPI00193180F3|nr:type II toxin-antitoxin system HicB family antitoxin [Skermanella rosea]UEM01772.1 type II toxin-antitoxin system HicB family antitoxin [Skermanella rosea]
MSVRYFPAIVEQGSDGFYVSFPDVPGCVSHGATLEELAANAEAALALHLAESAEDGRDLPVPSALGDTPVDPDEPEVCRLLVRAELPGKSVRINISMDEGLLTAIDAEAKRRDTSRSGFLSAAARRELGR